ncbi:MAG: hypothetical protein ACIARR_06060 [Phycisphaerales bacterium JB059]
MSRTPSPTTDPSPPTTGAPDLAGVAHAQRWLLWHVLALLGVTASLAISPVNAPVWVGSVKLSLYVIVTLLTIAMSVRLSLACAGSGAMTLVAALLMFIPMLNFALLASLNARATEILRAAGVRVGVMGAPLSEIRKLRPGLCRACGYDLSGLRDDRCPECGAPAQPPDA